MAIFTNQAILSYRNGTVSSNVVTGEIVEVLTATKNALIDTYSMGDTVTYVISILNSGSTPIDSITVSDDLGAYQFNNTALVPLTYVAGSVAFYIDGALQSAPTVNVGTSLVFGNISVPANGNAILIYQTRVNEFAPVCVNGEIVNTATVSGSGICEDIVVSETITASKAPMLGISKGISPTTVTDNGQLTYTFNIQNFGNSEATADDQIVVTDTFDPTLCPIVVTYNGELWTEGEQYTYNRTTGVFSTVAGNITVPAANCDQDPESGVFNVTPGESTLVVVGTVSCEC